MNLKKQIIIQLIGFFILAIGIIATINSTIIYGFQSTLWFCYIGLTILGLAIILKNPFLIVGQLNVLCIPLIIWTIDFFYLAFSNSPLWGITNYFFQPGPAISKLITLQHIFTVPLVVLALFILKTELKQEKLDKIKYSWIFSFAEIFILFFTTKILTNPQLNINCVFKFCGDISAPFYYPAAWFSIFAIMIVITNLVANAFINDKSPKYLYSS